MFNTVEKKLAGVDEEKLEACRAYARMINTLDFDHLEPWLDDQSVFESQWVFFPIEGKGAFREYMTGKIAEINEQDERCAWAEIGYTRAFGAGPCVIIAQDSMENLVAVLLITVKGGKISRMDLCCAPSPKDCIRTGEYPE